MRVTGPRWSLAGASTPVGTLYRGREGMWAWVLHRITGVAVFIFLLVHVADTAVVRISPAAYNQVMGMYHRPIMALGEAVLVAAVTLHGLNGIRVALIDLAPQGARWQRAIFYAVLGVFAVAMAFFLPAHFRNAFGSHEMIEAANTAKAVVSHLAVAALAVPALRTRRSVEASAGGSRERLGWLLMRGSGVLLIALVAGHIITNLMTGDGVRQINFAFVAGKWANPFWQTWSLLLLLLAMAHGANGMRTVIEDYTSRPATVTPPNTLSLRARPGIFASARFWLLALLYLLTLVVVALGVLVLFTLDPCPPGAPLHLLPSFCI